MSLHNALLQDAREERFLVLNSSHSSVRGEVLQPIALCRAMLGGTRGFVLPSHGTSGRAACWAGRKGWWCQGSARSWAAASAPPVRGWLHGYLCGFSPALVQGEAECLGPDCCVKSFRDVALGFGLGGASEVGSGIRWNLILLFCAYGKPQELSLTTTEVLCSLCFLEITAN